MNDSSWFDSLSGLEIAIIGMAGRFPGARDIAEFWRNLRDGVESISFLTDQELEMAGVDLNTRRSPNFVKARAALEHSDCFDASFFGFSPREAEITDPQHRLFLECAWEALENAGYDPERYAGSIGVYAGASLNSYYTNNLLSNPEVVATNSPFQLFVGNDKDFLATRTSYKLNLQGPSLNVQTACSTSLVALHLACRSLLGGECDMALAGGSTVQDVQNLGYYYQEGGIQSPDGHCRAFDVKAQGTVFGSGVGVVVVKRLTDALKEGDFIHAIVKGSAINNDGSLKVGYTAPSVEGQAQVIRMAHATSGVEADSISYIEAHGTGTLLGDPVEVAALAEAFGNSSGKQTCAIGSVKTNIGHLDMAAGVAGLIKTILALKHQEIPPSLHFEQPNPKIDFANSPFYVNAALREWKTDGRPRRAGVSSFGVGGTNAHVVLEEAPPLDPSGPSRPWQLLVLSAKTEEALEKTTANLAAHLRQYSEVNLADVAYTLQVGRGGFAHRRTVVCKDVLDAVTTLETVDAKRVLTSFETPRQRGLCFLFPGQGAQYVNMGRGLYEGEPLFRAVVDHCVTVLKPHLGFDLLEVLYPKPGGEASATERLDQTAVAQPALFVVEYALARLWEAWGLRPHACIGHSIGEYVAACLGGVFALEDALALVTQRGRLIQQLPGGSMLGVSLAETEIESLLSDSLSLAAVNGPRRCTVSGPDEAIDALQARLETEGIPCSRLHTSHAFHSVAVEPILEEFAACVGRAAPKPSSMPFVSNVTGKWITTGEATDSRYWAKHLRQTVRFADGLQTLLAEEDVVLLEVGPGHTLSTLARQQGAHAGLTSLRHPKDEEADLPYLLNTLGHLWLAGLEVDWLAFHGEERRRRVPLPTYPFARERYWIEPLPKRAAEGRELLQPEGRKPDVADWFYVPLWRQSVPAEPRRLTEQRLRWLVFLDGWGLGNSIVSRLRQAGQEVLTVVMGKAFSEVENGGYVANPRLPDDYSTLLAELERLGKFPQTIVHLWSVMPAHQDRLTDERFEESQAVGFYSLLYLAQAIGKRQLASPLRIEVVSNNLQPVTGDEVLCPEKATLLGPCKVIPQEFPDIVCRNIDVVMPESGIWPEESIEWLVGEFSVTPTDPVVAYRGNHRWVQTYEPVRLDAVAGRPSGLREGGVYLITGGLGGVGLLAAEYLARQTHAKLALVSRSDLPPRDEWKSWLSNASLAVGAKARGGRLVGIDIEDEPGQIERLEGELDGKLQVKSMRSYPGLEESLNQLCSSLVYHYLTAGDIDARKGQAFLKSELKSRLKIVPSFDKLYDSMLKILSEDGIISLEDGRIEFLKDSAEVGEPEALRREINQQHPGFKGLVELLEYCTSHYRAALSGEIEAISVLYPGGSGEFLENSRKSIAEHGNHRLNLMMTAEIVAASARKSKGRVKVLEVGGGSGELTRHMMTTLVDQDVEYHFTDIGRSFVVNAEREAAEAGLDFVKFGVLDISKDPLEQGYDAHEFDIILAYNVVHATRNIAESLGNLQRLLAPAGLICLVEQVVSQRWDNLMWGLAEGWWYFEDEELRKDSPLLSIEKWEEVVHQQGFEYVRVYPQDMGRRAQAESGLIIARKETEVPLVDAETEKKQQTRDKIERVQELEALGAEVLIASADVTDRERMQAVVSQVYERFGAIHGVIHAAGVLGGAMIQVSTPEMAAAVLAPKVKGALVLEEIFKESNLDFLVFFSSTVSIVGGWEQAHYCAANAFLDIVAHRDSFTKSINWDRWQNTGMAVGVEADYRRLTGKELLGGMSPQDGIDAFSRILPYKLNQILVSVRDFRVRLEPSESLTPSSPEALPQTHLSRQHPRPELANPYVAPRSKSEYMLVEIWQESLGIDQVGIHDDFFKLGGDSLLAMQVVAKARQMGIQFVPQQLLEHPTIAELTALEGVASNQAEQGLVTGPLPLTVAQHWFLDRGFLEPNRWNVNRLFEVPQTLNYELVERVVRHLLTHHDALRSRFVRNESGWRAFIAGPGETAPVICIDLSDLPETIYEEAFEQVGNDLQGSLDLSEGPIMRVGLYDLGADRPGRLLIVVHHITMDAQSTMVLLEDFLTTCQQLAQGEQIQLLPKTASLRQWNERLVPNVQTEMRQELGYWLNLPWTQIPPLPVDFPEGKETSTAISARRVEVRLSRTETDVLLRRIPEMYDTQILDVLLMGLVQAASKWTGKNWVAITLIDSGRSAIPATADLDLSRTIGWLDFTGLIVLECEETDNPGDALRSIRDQFRRIPNRGLGFDLLLRLSEDNTIVEKLTPLIKGDLKLNYMGNMDAPTDETGPVRPAQEPVGNWQNLQERRDGLLYCPAFITDDQFVMLWEYSEKIHKRATIEALANDFIETLRALIAHCQSQPERLAPSSLAEVRSPILPPTEQGLVTGPLPLMVGQHWFLETKRLEPNRWNVSWLFQVPQVLGHELVEQVVQHLLVHHDALRSRFVRDESGWHAFIAEPDGTAPVISIDLSALPEAVHPRAFEQVGNDLQGSLDLSAGPIMRVGLYHLGADKPGRLLIVVHHIIMDAQSTTVLLDDFWTACQQPGRGEQIRLLPKTTSVKQWVEQLTTYTRSAEMRRELDYWLNLPRDQIARLPKDFPEGEETCIAASSRRFEVRLSSAETEVLLHQIPAMYDTRILDVLLMGLVQAVFKWTGKNWVALTLIDSGRSAIPATADLDPSRTIGGLGLTGLIVLEYTETDNPGDALLSIRDQFRRIPNRGLGFDLLLRLSGDDEIAEKLTPLIAGDLALNYLGNVLGSREDESREEAGLPRPAQESAGDWQNPRERRGGSLFCPAFISNGQLVMGWDYSEDVHERATIEAVANDFIEALRALIVHCQSQPKHRKTSDSASGAILPQTEQELVTGPLPLTSAQRWFLEMERSEPCRFNNNALYKVHQRLDPVLVGQVVQRLLVHHDALRSRFVQDESGWRAFIAAPDGTAPVICVDLSALPEAVLAAAINQTGDDLQGSLSLSEGPLLRVGIYDLGADRPGRLHITMHHMAIDAHSITVLLEDFQTACLQLIRGEQIRLLPKTTSAKQWVERLIAYAQSAEMRQELDYWLNLPWSEVHRLPVDFPEGRQHNTIASTRSVEVRLNSAETDVLLRQILPMYNAQVLDVLLMGLVQATSRWTGRDWVAISLTDSGRGAIPNADDIDLSRTVGWLAHAGLVLLKRKETNNPGDALRSIRDQFRRIPNRGLGFDLLVRYSGDDEIVERLSSLHQDDLKLNYMGSIGGWTGEETNLVQPAQEACGNWQNPQNDRADLLYCPASISDGQLVVRWEYSENVYKRATIEALANDFIATLRVLIAHCQSQPKHPVPSDLAEVRSATLPPVEQGLITGPLPLTVSQRWFLGWDLENKRPESSRFNYNALYIVRQRLNFVAVEQVVHHLLIHHDALRSRFVRDESGWHAFIAKPDGTTPVIYVDLSDLPEIAHRAAVNQAGDNLQGSLSLSEGPLLRVGIYDLGADRPGRLHITMHHMAIDGYSIAVLLEDFQTAYQQLVRGEQIRLLPKTTSVKQWAERLITYAQSAEMRQELDYWLNLPWSEVHRLPVDFPEGRQHNTIASTRSVEVRLNSAETDVLLRQILPMYNAQVLDVLLMGLVQATSRWTARDWVAIWLSDSGRSAIPGADDIDLSCTVGWLAHFGFILLKREETDNPGEALRSVRDQFRRIPNRGLGFELLLRLSGDDEITEKLSSLLQDDLKLNYQGNITERSGNVTSPWQRTNEDHGDYRGPQEERPDFLYCPASISGGQLVMEWVYSENIHKRATIEALANDFIETLRALIAYVESEGSARSASQRLLERRATAELATAKGQIVPHDEQGLITGPVPLLPTQAWLLSQDFASPNRFAISEMFEVPRLYPGLVERAVQALLLHHDVLRARFVQETSGWRQFIAEPDDTVPFALLDFSEVPDARHKEVIEFAADALQSVFNLSAGPLIQVAFFDLGADRTGRLLIYVHHLVSDGYSQGILFEDLQTACLQLSRGEQIQLPPKTTSFKRWAEWLNAYAQSDELRPEWDYWLARPWTQVAPLPADYPENIEWATRGSLSRLPAALTAEETEALQRLLRVHGFQMLDALLMALVDTLARWSGERKQLLNVLDSGRSAIPFARDVDLSRTVGFLALSRLLVLEQEDGHPLDALRAFREQIQRIPSRGLGLTLLYHCGSPEIAGRLDSHCKPEILFDYMGHRGADNIAHKSLAEEAQEEYRDPDEKLNNLALRCTVRIRGDRLVSTWRYSKVIHKRATIERLADGFLDALRALIAHCDTTIGKAD